MIISAAVLWYGLVPMIGGLVTRYRWYLFRKRFDELRLRPLLDYSRYRRAEDGAPSVFRFIGRFESVTDRQTMWICGDDLTIPVSLQDAQTYQLSMQEKEGAADIFDPGEDAPERIRWERVSSLVEGAKVFVGGLLECRNGRRGFVSTKDHPLTVIFFDGDEEHLALMVNRAGRHRSDYWNPVTPFSLILGALCQILIAVLFMPRPAFRLTVIVSFIAMFIPLYPILPPGLLFSIAFRRLTWKSRMLRIDSGIARLHSDEDAPGLQAAARRNSASAYMLETLAWLTLLAGIGLNIFFLSLILALL